MKIQRSRIPQKIYIVFIILYPILNNYKFIIPIGDIMGICLLPYFLLEKRAILTETIYSKQYYIFLLYCLIILPIVVLLGGDSDLGDIFSKCFHLVLYATYALYLGKKYFNYDIFFEKFINILNVLVYLAIFQQIIYALIHHQIYYIIPNIPLNYSVENYDSYISMFRLAAASQGYRASSLFLEPAHFALFVVIGLAYRLLKPTKEYNDFIMVLLYLVAIVFSYSTGGVLSAVIVVLYYIFFYRTEMKGRYDTLFKITLTVIAIFGVIFVLSTNSLLLTTIQNRINSIGSTVYDTSGNRRVLRGYYVWKEIPILNKILGTGMGNLLAIIKTNNIIVLTDTKFSDEMSTLFYSLCSVGIVGSFLYFFSIIKNWSKAQSFGKLIIILYLFSCIFNNILLHATSAIYLVLMFSCQERIYKYDKRIK